MARRAKGLVIAAPHSGSGKTLISLGLCRAWTDRGVNLAPAKSGPDFIDPHFLAQAARKPCVNLDAWAMSSDRVQTLAHAHAQDADIFLVEGVMGLFDGAQNGTGSTADLAAALDLPIVLVIDASHMAQSIAAIAHGFTSFRADISIAGIVLNRVASDRHEDMLRTALAKAGMRCLGAVRRDDALAVPSRHLGLVLPADIASIELMMDKAAASMASQIDMPALRTLAKPLTVPQSAQKLAPLGQHIAIAKDAAFSFLYHHFLRDWREQGANLSFFSPLANEAPPADADAIFLPGGYPELHAAALAAAERFHVGLHAAKKRDALIYGECGGYMVLGKSLTDKAGVCHKMTGLLPQASFIDQPRRTLGYRQLTNLGPLPFGAKLRGHEFHYSTQDAPQAKPLFTALDAAGEACAPMGAVDGKTCGSYAHIIDQADLR